MRLLAIAAMLSLALLVQFVPLRSVGTNQATIRVSPLATRSEPELPSRAEGFAQKERRVCRVFEAHQSILREFGVPRRLGTPYLGANMAFGGKARAERGDERDQSRRDVRFDEVAQSSGIRFEHFDPVTENQYISETIGSGAGWLDFDGDGYLDLVLVNSAPMPGSPLPPQPPRNQFYRNRRDGTFEEVTDRVWICAPGFGQGCAAADFDNDGFDDLTISYYLGPNRLYHNNGDGTFEEISARAGTDCPLWSTSCAWGDLDGDGDLDLYVCNYLEMPLDKYPYCGDPRHKVRTLCSPLKFEAQPDVVYRNDGDGNFTDVSEVWGFRPETGRGLGVVIADLDNDGLPDVYVANDRSPNFLFRNLGGGRFQEQGILSGCALSADGKAQAGMGVDAGDIDGDGRLDLFVTNFFHEPNSLFRNESGSTFREISTDQKNNWFGGRFFF